MKKVPVSPLLAATLLFGVFFQACQKDHVAPLVHPEKASASLNSSDRCMCLPPYTISVSGIGATTASISWDEMPESEGYQVEWLMEANVSTIDSSLLFVVQTEGNSINLSNLKPNHQYAVRVINVCRLLNSNPPAWIPFKTAPKAISDSEAASTQY